MNNLNDFRIKIQEIDQEIINLFIKRMNISKQIGKFKNENNMPIEVKEREDELIKLYQENFPDDSIWPYFQRLFKEILTLSKEIQNE